MSDIVSPASEPEKLPPKENFSEWYNELIRSAEIMDVRYPVKGLYVWMPFGFSLRNRVFSILKELLDVEHQELLFPLLIPKQIFMKEAEHIKGFEDEVYWVTHGGTELLDVHLALRPTSETAIYPMFSLWIRSHADLPIRVYQIVNTFRYETKHTRPLIRLREITSFKEAHTAHATWEDAEEQVNRAVRLYEDFYHRLCIPFILSRRPVWDRFPGADYTLALDVLMPDGKTLQVGTAHHLGTNFAKTFDITYEDVNGEQQPVNQTCYGISERCIAALISIHGDGRGLVLPPEVAPIQVVIVPIVFTGNPEVMEAAHHIKEMISEKFRCKLDDTNRRPGSKFYKWEMEGVPIRIEVGPKDVETNSVVLAPRIGNKRSVPIDVLEDAIIEEFKHITDRMYDKAVDALKSSIKVCYSIKELEDNVGKGILITGWCGNEECGHALEDVCAADVLGEVIKMDVLLEGEAPTTCPVCGKPAISKIALGKPY
ncbi:MAG: proline--tRNA ligase [Methermicoccaceae archaeon]